MLRRREEERLRPSTEAHHVDASAATSCGCLGAYPFLPHLPIQVYGSAGYEQRSLNCNDSGRGRLFFGQHNPNSSNNQFPPSTHRRRKPRIRLRCRHRPVSPRRGSPLPSAHRTGSWPATKLGKIANASTAIVDRTTLPFHMRRDSTHYHSRSKIGGSGPVGQRVFYH